MKLGKVQIQTLLRITHLAYIIGSHIWSLFAQIHMKSWPKVKLGKKFKSVRTLLRITHLAHRKLYLVIICASLHEKLTKIEIRSSYYLLQIGFIYPYLAPKYHFCPYLALLTYIWLHLGLIILIWAYLPLIALISPYVPYSPYICMLLWRLHLCAKF